VSFEGCPPLRLRSDLCAAEKRRRRKRGMFLHPHVGSSKTKRLLRVVAIAVCKSIACQLVTVDTEFGQESAASNHHRVIRTSLPVPGFWPSFVTVEGGRCAGAKALGNTVRCIGICPRRPWLRWISPIAFLVDSARRTGVVTIGALLGMAAT